MTIQQNFQQRPKSFKEFTATGMLVSDVPTTMCNNLRVVVENVGGGNTIVIRGKLFQQTAWQVLATINGATTGTTVDISLVEEYQVECTAYAASGGTPIVVAAAFFNQATGGGGGVTGASNIGSSGVGVFDALSGSTLQFKNINAGSSKITVVNDAGNKEVDIDVDESQIDVRNLDNVSPGTNNSFAGWNGSGELASVPGWSYDDTAPSQIGIQNGVTIPAGTTDYISISISPTVANAGLTSLAGVQLNSPINQTAGTYDGFQVFGYGTSKPTTFTGFLSQPGYTGVGTTQNHFLASGNADVTGSLQGFSMNCSGDAGSVSGLNVSPTGSYTDATGISIDFSSATITNRPVGLNIQQGSLTSVLTFQTTPALLTLVDSGNVLRPIFEVASGSPIAGTDVIMNNLAGFMDIKDDMSFSALALGAVSVGFISQVAVDSGKTLSSASMCLGALAIDASSNGGTIQDATIFKADAISFGGSLTIDVLYGFRMMPTASSNATLTWGICIEDTGAENFLGKSLVVGDNGSWTVTNSDIALEIGTPKAIRLGRTTTAEKEAMADVDGLFVYDTDVEAPYYNDGTQWLQVAVGPARILTASATLDFPNIGSNAFEDLTVSVPGVVDSDVVSLGVPNSVMGSNLIWTCWVSAPDVVTIRATNPSGGAHNPPSALFKVMITQF